MILGQLRIGARQAKNAPLMGSDFNIILKDRGAKKFPQEKEEILSKQGEELSDLQEQLLRARESGKLGKF